MSYGINTKAIEVLQMSGLGNFGLDKLGLENAREKFARAVLKKLNEARPQEKWHFDKESFALKQAEVTEEAAPELLYLENLFLEYENAEDKDKPAFLAKAVSITEPFTMPETFEEAKANLLVNAMPIFNIVIVSMQLRKLAEENRRHSQAQEMEEQPLPYSLISSQLGLIFVLDRPAGKAYIDQATINKWGVPVDELFDVATMNLARMTARGGFNGISREPGGPCCLYQSVLQDSYEGARIIFPQLFEELPIKGDPVMVVPNNDVLLVTGSEDEDGLALCLEAYERAQSLPNPLPPLPLIGREGKLEDFLPPVSSPLHLPFKRLKNLYLNSIYAEQKKVLEETTCKGPDAPFVATFAALEKKEGHSTEAISSVTTWSQEIDSLLPEAEQVALVVGQGKDQKVLGFAPWEKVLTVAGERLERTGYFPPRFRTRGALTQSEITQLTR